jgi:hypothetical protein
MSRVLKTQGYPNATRTKNREKTEINTLNTKRIVIFVKFSSVLQLLVFVDVFLSSLIFSALMV